MRRRCGWHCHKTAPGAWGAWANKRIAARTRAAAATRWHRCRCRCRRPRCRPVTVAANSSSGAAPLAARTRATVSHGRPRQSCGQQPFAHLLQLRNFHCHRRHHRPRRQRTRASAAAGRRRRRLGLRRRRRPASPTQRRPSATASCPVSSPAEGRATLLAATAPRQLQLPPPRMHRWRRVQSGMQQQQRGNALLRLTHRRTRGKRRGWPDNQLHLLRSRPQKLQQLQRRRS